MLMKQIPQFPNYMISTAGEIISLDGVNVKAWIANGYQYVKLKDIAGQFHLPSVHRLVALTYIANPTGLPYVCHKDDIKTHNDVSNLFWGTPADNTHDMIAKGRKVVSPGQLNGKAVLTEVQIKQIRQAPYYRGLTRVLADTYGVSMTCISLIRNNKTWVANDNTNFSISSK